MSQLLQGVIFDMDGLMFDTERLSARCWEQVGRKFGLDITESFLAGVRGVTSQEFRRIFEQKFGERADYETVMDRKKELFCQEIRQNGVPVKPGLPELLEFLQEQKIPAAMATATNQEIAREYLSKTGPLFLISWYLATRSGGESRTQRFFSAPHRIWAFRRNAVWSWKTA